VLQAVLRAIAAADAEDAMPVGDLQLLLGSRVEGLARVDATDVGAERAAQSVRVFRAEQEVVVGKRARSRDRPGLTWMPDERRAIPPAADDLRGDPLGHLLPASRGDARVAHQGVRRLPEKVIECGRVLFELAHDEKGAVPSQVSTGGGRR
jgi:hypothetical protein